MVSDRAKALIQLAEQGLECLSMPDFFHVVHEIVKSYSLAIGQRWRHAQQELTKAKEALARRQGQAQAEQADSRGQGVGGSEASRGDAMGRGAHTPIGATWRRLSLTLHPFRISDSTPQTSAQVESQLTAAVEAIEALAQGHQLPARHDGHDQGPQAGAGPGRPRGFLVARGPQDLEPFLLSPRWQQWVHECLLPMVYWAHQVPRTRCRRRKAKMQEALEAVRAAFDQHAITQRLAPHVLAEWHAWATDRVKAFQRASSAVEGRNGYSVANASQSAGLAQAALQGVDGLA